MNEDLIEAMLGTMIAIAGFVALATFLKAVA